MQTSAPSETIHQALLRECHEELGVEIQDAVLTGFYYHSSMNAKVGIYVNFVIKYNRILEAHMELLIIIVLIIGLAGMIGNQYSMLKRMEGIEAILREIRDKK
jgi:hypothetical protein